MNIPVQERYDLVNIISQDLRYNDKLLLILLILVLTSAILVVMVTYHTRQLIAEREQIILEKDALDIEWRNLTLEKNVLGAHSRIERLAVDQLNMQHVDPTQENILVNP